MGLSVVLVGNPVNGLEVFGPFATPDEAVDWASSNSDDQDWWVAPLQAQDSSL